MSTYDDAEVTQILIRVVEYFIRSSNDEIKSDIESSDDFKIKWNGVNY